jgi:hypothetical protein
MVRHFFIAIASGAALAAAASCGSSSSNEGSGGTTTGHAGAGGEGLPIDTGGNGGGGSCEEMPCRLVAPQCGCTPGTMCSLDAGGQRLCTQAGSNGETEVCGPAAECSPGLLCAETTPTLSTCAVFCSADADCSAPGGLCIVSLQNDRGAPIPDAKLCTANCVPTTNRGCNAVGTGCQLARETDGAKRAFSYCTGAGTGEQGAACAAADDCAATFGCFSLGTDPMCLAYCDVAAPICPSGTTCVAVQIDNEDVIVGNEHYGACVTP